MVSTRSGRRTSVKTKQEGVAKEPEIPSTSLTIRNVYDIPSNSSEDSNCVLPSKLDRLTLGSKLVHTQESTKKRAYLKRSHGEPVALSERTEVAEPVHPDKPPKSPRFGPARTITPKTTQTMSADRVVKRGQHSKQTKEIASAPTTPSITESSVSKDVPTSTDKVTKQKQHTMPENKGSSALAALSVQESLSAKEFTMSVDRRTKRSQQSKRRNTPASAPTTPSSPPRPSTLSADKQVKGKQLFLQKNPSTSAPATPTSTARRSPHQTADLLDVLQPHSDVDKSPTEATEAEKTISRSVRFCEESRNEVHIIPAVKTTVPFAEQMAKELEAEAQLVTAFQREEEAPNQEQLDENIVPKCSKIIIGQRFIAVDFFVRKEECRYYFLTHAHFDHIVNLSKSWKSPIYCSELTAKLLPIVMGPRAPLSKVLRPLKVGESHIIEPNFSVTVLEAHHCLGSVMYLFEGASIPGGSVLCTGDFRADRNLLAKFDNDLSFQKLAETSISKIYLDNTYLDYDEPSFPERSESGKILLAEMEKLRERPVLIPVFRLGREDILEKLSETLSEPIATGKQRLAVRKASGMKGGTFLDESNLTRIRTCPRQAKSVFAALKKMSPSTAVVDLSIRGEYQEVLKENLVSIPYSDHSSRDEIFAFMSRLRFGEVIPISAPMQLTTAEELMKVSREMAPISAASCATTVDIQTSVEARPVELGETETITPPASGLRFSAVSLQPADLSVFQLPCGINLLDFCPNTGPSKFCLDPPLSPKPIKLKFYDVDGNILK